MASFTNCEQPSVKTSSKNDVNKEEQKPYHKTEQYIKAVEENLPQLEKIESLSWHKMIDDQNVMLEVVAYMDEFGSILKLVESYNDETIQELGKKEFYLENDQLIASSHAVDELMEDGNYRATRTTTYYKDEVPAYSFQQEANFIDELDQAEKLELAEHSTLSISKTLDVLNHEGPYSTHYLSFVESNNSIFLVLGEPKSSERFSATVLVEEVTPFIQELIDHSEKHQFKKVDITYRTVGGNGQPKFKLLEEISFVE